ncbi:MAG: type II secretion system F family protein, partial [archaeon]|nr:type II secretion system F family protein [archaeon]
MKFNYQARDEKGENQIGVIEASSREAALKLLAGHKLYVTTLETAKAGPVYAREIEFFSRVPAREIMLFSRQLSIMFKARVPLVEALRTLAVQTKKRSFKEKLMRISEEVEGGTSFSNSLKMYPEVFSDFYVNMAASGEASGQLSDVLGYMAEHLEREYTLKSKVRGALVYPAFIVLVASAVLFLLMYMVIPNLADVLQDTGRELPLVTQIVIVLADITRSWGWVFLLALAGGAILLWRYSKTPQGKAFFSVFVLKVPMIGSVFQMVYLSRFAENLSTLIAGGLPIAKALDITGTIVGNDVYKNIILEGKEVVRGGSKISSVLEKYPDEFPPVFTQMVSVGEKSGSLDEVLRNIVDFYQKEVERAIETFLSILEPLLIVVLGLLVGGLMASVLLPLYQ